MKMSERPKLDLKITPLELILNIVTLILFIGSIIYLVYNWGTLPAKVPGHYNSAGEITRWGSKWELIILPIISVILWIGLTILEKYPHTYNYIKLKKDNVRGQYLNGRLMVNVLKNITVLIFVFLDWKSIQLALSSGESLGSSFLPIFYILMFVPLAYFVVRSFFIKK